MPVHHIIFKHAPHLVIPAVIYLKHAPRLGDAGSSCIFNHAPHLAIPAIIDLKHARPGGVPSYILNTPPHWTIPVYHTYLDTPLIW